MLLGFRKYFIVVLLAVTAASTATLFAYRGKLHMEQARRAAIESELQQTVAAFDEFRRVSSAQIEAMNRALAEGRQMADQQRIQRERVLNAPPSQNGGVAPVLRCAVTGVC